MTVENIPALEPCPFCGAAAKTFLYNGAVQATCSAEFTECAGSDVSAPVAMWNRRASLAKPVEPDGMPGVEGLVSLLDRFERAAMGYERLGKLTRDDEKTRAIRKDTIAELAGARAAIRALFATKSLYHETGERITRKDLNNAYREGQQNGRLAAHLIDGVPTAEAALASARQEGYRAGLGRGAGDKDVEVN
jgi:uncharacterized caspase-like protein